MATLIAYAVASRLVLSAEALPVARRADHAHDLNRLDIGPVSDECRPKRPEAVGLGPKFRAVAPDFRSLCEESERL